MARKKKPGSKPWLSTTVPDGFWDSRANRRSYMDWLGDRLGYRCMEDWYAITAGDFFRNAGAKLLEHYELSVGRAVMDLFPGCDWCEWKFQLPRKFWNSTENRHRYLRWLGNELGFCRPEDWFRVRKSDFESRFGGRLLKRFGTIKSLLGGFLPHLDRNWSNANPDFLPKKLRPGRTPQRASKPPHVYPTIRIEEILAWAEAHHATHGEWPKVSSGEIPGAERNWAATDEALRNGSCGLPGGMNLAKLLEKERGVVPRRNPLRLSEKQVLAWADAYFAATGKWPGAKSGPISGTRENWFDVNSAMRLGHRGFPRCSLAQLLERRRGMRNVKNLPPLTEEQILAWADAYFAAQGKWPGEHAGSIPGTSEKWSGVQTALTGGGRGLCGASTLARFLAQHRGARNRKALPRLTEEQILAWAKAHFSATGEWPRNRGGPITQSPGDKWGAVSECLRVGTRGLPGGSSLTKLLRKHGLS